jgi:hypothetical protein
MWRAVFTLTGMQDGLTLWIIGALTTCPIRTWATFKNWKTRRTFTPKESSTSIRPLGHAKELTLDSDYIYVLQQCLFETDAPYIAIFEDDIIFADGWLVKTLDALGDAQLRSNSSWLYLRLFYTETSLGWQASEDFWYGHKTLTFPLTMGAILFLLLLGKWCVRPLDRRLDIATIIVLVLVATPAFTAMIFMAGKYNINPLKGVERMDRYGCCTQALVFPRSQMQDLIDFLGRRGSGQTDSLIEEYADSGGLERYALAPQVVQHVGLISSRNNLAINAQSTWAFWFETQDPLKLRKEHDRLVSEGSWGSVGHSP